MAHYYFLFLFFLFSVYCTGVWGGNVMCNLRQLGARACEMNMCFRHYCPHALHFLHILRVQVQIMKSTYYYYYPFFFLLFIFSRIYIKIGHTSVSYSYNYNYNYLV